MIDSNNQFKKLSHSLIESVRTVMEKKTNKHGHDAVGHEDSDIDNDGDTDKSDEYLHNRRKAIKHAMKKEEVEAPAPKSSGLDLARNVLSKMHNEEAEELDELSTDTLKSYRNKARAQGNKIVDKMKMGGGDWSKDQKDTQILRKRSKGANMSGKQLVKRGESLKTEEVEAIVELSKKTLASYVKGAANHRAKLASQINTLDNARRAVADAQGALDDPSHANAMTDQIRKKTKKLDDKDYNRKYGTHLALKKLAKEEVELDEALDAAARYGDHHTAIKSLLKSISQHVESHKADALKHKDYRGKKGVHWGHVGDLADVHSQLANIHDRLAQQGEYKKSMSESLEEAKVDGVAAGSMDNDGHLCATKVFHKEWAEGTPIFSQHAEPDENGDIAWYDVMFEHGIEKMVATDDLEILMAETHERHGKRKMKEETELDESAKVAAHLIKRYGDNVRKSHVRSAANDFGVGYVALSHAVRKKLGVNRLEEDTEELDEVSAATKDAYAQKAAKQLPGLFKKSGSDADAARKYYNRKNTVRKIANEETELDEARGRPRKNPLPTGQSDEPEPRQHIMQQLQRAKLSMRGGEHITFKDGTKHHVSGTHAAKILGRYSAMKPAEKEAFQKKIHASHAAFKEEL